MNIVFKKHTDPLVYRTGFHVLTYAEVGFAPLDIYARNFALSRHALADFVEAVNGSGEVGTLYPAAPISAVPQACIRDTAEPGALEGYISEFVRGNARHIHASYLLFDFSTPRLPRHAEEALACILKSPLDHEISEITIIKN